MQRCVALAHRSDYDISDLNCVIHFSWELTDVIHRTSSEDIVLTISLEYHRTVPRVQRLLDIYVNFSVIFASDCDRSRMIRAIRTCIDLISGVHTRVAITAPISIELIRAQRYVRTGSLEIQANWSMI
jgi:hypothetical protein